MVRSLKRGLPRWDESPTVFHVGRSWAESLVRALNGGRGDRKVEGVRQLVRDINECDRLLAGRGYPRATRRDELPELRIGECGEQVEALMERIDEAYKKLLCQPKLLCPTKSGWIGEWEYRTPNGRTVTGPTQIWLAAVYGLAVGGLLGQVRECKACKRWLFARRKDQRFCSGGCREKDYRSSQEGRAKRTAYMRRYRNGLRRRDEENLRVARKKRK